MSRLVPLADLWQRAGRGDDGDRATPSAWPGNAADAEDERVLLDGDRLTPLRQRGSTAPLDDGVLTGLIGRIERRDPRALETLYQLACSRIYAFVHRFTRSHALTEEVVEDTFWQVWRQAPRFRLERGRAMTWLLAMARSRAIDALRREQRFRCEPLAVDDDARIDERAPDLLEAARGASHLHGALVALEPRARQLLALAFFRGLTHEEIAAHTAMPLGSVKSVIRRALRQLRAHLEAAPAAASTSIEGAP